MSQEQIESVDERRLIEIDAALKRLNTMSAIVVAGAAVLFFGRFGVGFLAFASLPMLWWAGRSVLRLQHRIGLRRWNAVLIVAMITSIVGGSATSGGLASPVVFFAGFVGMLAHATFPTFRYFRVGGLIVVAMIACIDIVRGRPIEVFSFITATVIAGYLPLIVQQLVDVEQVQRRSAVLDVLTGCLNRRSFEQRSVEIDAQARHTGAVVAVISLDIDHFKAVNDQWGHAAGDHVLKNVAYVARKQLRRFELMFRLGGEEFVVVLPGTGVSTAMAIAEQIRRRVENTVVNGISVTLSCGVAVGPDGVEGLLAKADERLYLAKKSGRNCVIGPDRPQSTERLAPFDSPSQATAG